MQAKHCPFQPRALLPFQGDTHTPPWTPALATSIFHRQHIPEHNQTYCAALEQFLLWSIGGNSTRIFISNPINLHWHLVEILRPKSHSQWAGWDLHLRHVLLNTTIEAAGLSKAAVSAGKTRPCSVRSHCSWSTNIILSDPHRPN